MKNTHQSRRKFLAGMGIAAGAAVVLPTINSLSALERGGKAVTDRPAFLSSEIKLLKPVRSVSRLIGTCRVPLAIRPL